MRTPRASFALLLGMSLAACQATPAPSPAASSSLGATKPAELPPTPAAALPTALPTAPSRSAAEAATPRPVAQRQGGQYWAVYTALGDTQEVPAVKASIAELKRRRFEFGVTFGFGSLGCDLGAARALKASDEANAVGVYFATEAEARAFAATVTPPALGVARIKALCRD